MYSKDCRVDFLKKKAKRGTECVRDRIRLDWDLCTEVSPWWPLLPLDRRETDVNLHSNRMPKISKGNKSSKYDWSSYGPSKLMTEKMFHSSYTLIYSEWSAKSARPKHFIVRRVYLPGWSARKSQYSTILLFLQCLAILNIFFSFILCSIRVRTCYLQFFIFDFLVLFRTFAIDTIPYIAVSDIYPVQLWAKRSYVS